MLRIELPNSNECKHCWLQKGATKQDINHNLEASGVIGADASQLSLRFPSLVVLTKFVEIQIFGPARIECNVRSPHSTIKRNGRQKFLAADKVRQKFGAQQAPSTIKLLYST